MATLPTPFFPVRDVSTPLLRDRIRALFRQVPQGLAGQEEAIHQMRVAGRRLRVALPLLAQRPEGRRVRRALRVLRQLTRTAGASRDLDVIAGLLSACVHVAGAEPSREALLLERRLLTARRRSRLRMAEALLDLEIAQLRRDLRAIVRRRGEEQFSTLSRLHQLRDQAGRELIDAILVLGDRFDSVRLHDLRKLARRLRYAAELGVVLRGTPSEAPDVLRELQGHLGEIHDLHVLAAWLLHQAEQARQRGGDALAAEAQRLEGLFLDRAIQGHQALLASKLEETVERALEAMGRARSAA